MDKLFWCPRNIASLVTLNGSFWVISSETVGCGACPFRRPPPGGCLCSSAGQSVGLINPRSWVRSPPRVFFFYACGLLFLPTRAPSRVPTARKLDLRPMPQKRPTARVCAKAPRRNHTTVQHNTQFTLDVAAESRAARRKSTALAIMFITTGAAAAPSSSPA